MITTFLFYLNFAFLYQQPKTQRFLDINDKMIKEFKAKTSEDELEVLPPIQFERPEAISANQ